MAAREALAYGRPVVATGVGGLADLSGPGVVDVSPGDVVQLRAAIESLLADDGLRAQLGQAGAARAREQWDTRVTGSALADVYARALAAGV